LADRAVRTQVVFTGRIRPEARNIFATLAGLRTGDVLLSYDGQELYCARAFIQMKNRERQGDKPRELRLLREGMEMTLLLQTGPIRLPPSGPWLQRTYLYGTPGRLEPSFVESNAVP